MKVCIAEKPSVAKEIAKILGANQRKDGYFQGDQYAVTWTFGHLCTLYTPDDYKPHWKRWDFNTLPMLPERFETKVISNQGVQKQFQVVKSLFEKADLVINCGDAGQEGELIQRWVLKMAGYTGPVERLWISSLTPEAIKEGFQQLKPSETYEKLYHAGSARAIGDWLLGMNATRLYTLKYGRNNRVLSIGRVQTPTLAMVVERHLEIENFKPQPYWELQTVFKGARFAYEEGRFLAKEKGEEVVEKIKDLPLEITSVSKKKGKELHPPLFDLTGLQVYANNKFSYSADQTLKIAQNLYEQKLITYPRVDTTYLPMDQYPKIQGILNGLKAYSTLIEPLRSGPLKKSKKVFNDSKVTDHHAIIPTGLEGHLSELDRPVYDAIVKRFIAAFYPDCEYAQTQMKAQVDGYEFKATGKVIVNPGWRAILKSSKSISDKKTTELPDLKKGDKGPHEPLFEEKTTSPPKPFTEATLLRGMETAGKKVDNDELRDLMKANGIGRPSTRANIIETLFKREYIRKEKKNLIPTNIGVELIQTIKNKLLTSAELTGQWEKKLKDIEGGTYSAARFIHEMKYMVDSLVTEVRSEQSSAIVLKKNVSKAKKKKALTPCPKCKNGSILKGKELYGCSSFKEGCDFRLPQTYAGKKISESQIDKLIKKGQTDLLKGFKFKDNKLNGRLVINESFELSFKPNQAKKDKDNFVCPSCQKGSIQKDKSAFICDQKTDCGFEVSFDKLRAKAQGQKLDKETVRKIIRSFA